MRNPEFMGLYFTHVSILAKILFGLKTLGYEYKIRSFIGLKSAQEFLTSLVIVLIQGGQPLHI